MIKGLNLLAPYHISPLYESNSILTTLQKEDPYSRSLISSNYSSFSLGFLSPTTFPSHLPVFHYILLFLMPCFPQWGIFFIDGQLLRNFPNYQRERERGFKMTLSDLPYLCFFIPSCYLMSILFAF